MNIIDIIKEAVIKFWKNPVLGLPALINFFAAYIPIIIMIGIVSLTAGVSIFSVFLYPESITEETLMQMIPLVVGLFIVTLIAMLAIMSLFDGVLIAMLNSKKIEFNFSGAKFFSRIFAYNLILMAYLIAGMSIMFLSLFLLYISPALIIVTILLAIAFVLSSPLFILGPYYIVIKNLNAIDGLKISFKIGWKNYFSLFGLVILVILIEVVISLIFGLIPFLGLIISNVLLFTFARICFYLFAITARK